jgi:hypothetical protein
MYAWFWDADVGAARLANELMVRDGYAVVTTLPPDVKYVDRLTNAQDHARFEDAGLWQACGGADTPLQVPAPTATVIATTAVAPTMNAAGSIASPKITLGSSSGTVGATLRVNLTGFPAGRVVTVQWDGLTEARVTTSTAGTAATVFAVPAAPNGAHAVTAIDGTTRVSASFTVVPSLSLSPAQGPAGSTVVVRLRGYAAHERMSLRWYDGSAYVVLASERTTSAGSVNFSVEVPTDARPGGYMVEGRGVAGSVAARTFTVTAAE